MTELRATLVYDLELCPVTHYISPTRWEAQRSHVVSSSYA